MRKRRFIAAVLLTALLAVSGTAAGDGTARCLLVGCDRFVSMPATEPASANNLGTAERILKMFLPEMSRVTRQENPAGNEDGFRDLILAAFSDAGDEDLSLIYLSTHGVVRIRDGAPEMVLLLSDGRTEDGLRPEKLREMLDEVPGQKVLVLDACRSGAAIGEGAETFANAFEGGNYRILVSSGSDEESWFWNSRSDEYTGTGYFTAALENALRASAPEQIDPDGDGSVSLAELTARLREIHGLSMVYCYPRENGEKLFSLPEGREDTSRIQGLQFDGVQADGDALVLNFHFSAGAPVRLMYQMVPSLDGRWDFEHAITLPDKEKTGTTRGLLRPGDKQRKIRLTAGNLGADGRVLLQIISLHGEEQTPAIEGSRVIRMDEQEKP